MVAHEKRNSAQLFCAVPTRNDLALSSLLFPAQPTQKLEYPKFLVVTVLFAVGSCGIVKLKVCLKGGSHGQHNDRSLH